MTSDKHSLNLFPVTIDGPATLTFQHISVSGIPPTPDQARYLQQLLKQMAYRLKNPIALIHGGDLPELAVGTEATITSGEEINLSPWVVRLEPLDKTTQIDMNRIGPTDLPVTRAFVEFSLRGRLMRRGDYWGSGRRWFSKTPTSTRRRSPLRYPGFVWQVIEFDGRLYVSIDPTSKYVAAESLAADPETASEMRFRHCLYRFGHDWYEVQLMNVLPASIRDHRFYPYNSTDATDVFSYTKGRCNRQPPTWIHNLDPDGPAVIYRYPGNHQERAGALQLCWLMHRTNEPEVAELHEESILPPRERLGVATELAESVFEGAQICGAPLVVSPTALTTRARVFDIPDLQFGQGRVLQSPSPGTRRTYPRARESMLYDRNAGPLTRDPFGPQYLILPQSVARRINEDFEYRLTQSIKRISQDGTYSARRIIYDDRSADTMYQHVQGIRSALQRSNVRTGYGLLLLPAQAPSDLHHWVKRDLQPGLQLKCASAAALLRHYRQDGSIVPNKENRLRGYIDNCAIGTLLVNRRWLWALRAQLHHDVHIGIDVLGGVAGLTYLYDGGRRIIFESCRGAQAERLSSGQLATAMAESLAQHLQNVHPRPRSILIYRDGRLFESERRGIESAVRRLQGNGILPLDVQIGFVEVHKHTSNNLRIFKGEDAATATMPDVGTWWALTDTEGIVCTTGGPFPLRGTPQPLALSVSGATTLAEAIEDSFRLSQLGYSAPASSTRLPIVLKLADDFLEATASQYDEEAAEYDLVSEVGEGA